jgi:hypothetical protein
MKVPAEGRDMAAEGSEELSRVVEGVGCGQLGIGG